MQGSFPEEVLYPDTARVLPGLADVVASIGNCSNGTATRWIRAQPINDSSDLVDSALISEKTLTECARQADSVIGEIPGVGMVTLQVFEVIRTD
jgi:hypothetical protein